MKPNPIDFDKVLVEFDKLGETGNVAVIVTIAVVFMTYIVVVIMVRKADEKDAARRVSKFNYYFNYLWLTVIYHLMQR